MLDDEDRMRKKAVLLGILLVALLLAVLAFSSCESAKFRPWLSYSDYDGQNIGINETGSQFINSPLGSSWTVGLGFEFPMGPASPQIVKFNWPDLPPRYDLVKHEDGKTVILGASKPGAPELSTTDEALKVAKEVSSWGPDALMSVAIALGLLLVGAFGFLAFMRGWRKLKGQPANGD